METFNKNWLAISLIAIVFFLLGFLIAKTCQSCSKKCNSKANSCRIDKERSCGSHKAYYKKHHGVNKEIEVEKETTEK